MLQSRRYIYIRILRCQLLAAICKTVKDNSRTLYPNQGIRSDLNILKTVRRELYRAVSFLVSKRTCEAAPYLYNPSIQNNCLFPGIL